MYEDFEILRRSYPLLAMAVVACLAQRGYFAFELYNASRVFGQAVVPATLLTLALAVISIADVTARVKKCAAVLRSEEATESMHRSWHYAVYVLLVYAVWLVCPYTAFSSVAHAATTVPPEAHNAFVWDYWARLFRFDGTSPVPVSAVTAVVLEVVFIAMTLGISIESQKSPPPPQQRRTNPGNQFHSRRRR
jgi:hypothetical protein